MSIPTSLLNFKFFKTLVVFNDITGKSREQRFITKEHIAMYTNLILLALYSSILVIRLFRSYSEPEFIL